jgi:hypothetical protein
MDSPLLVLIFTAPSADAVAIGKSDAAKLVANTPVAGFILSPLPTLTPPKTELVAIGKV